LNPRAALAVPLLVLALLSPAARLRAETSDPAAFAELLQLLAARQHGHVSFTEEHFFKMLERPLESSGELLYEAPDHLEKRTLAPQPETLVLDHGVVTARRGQRVRVLALKDYPQIVPFVESVRATLAGDRAALGRYFRPQFSGTLADWSLLLLPADPTVSRSVREIHITGARERIATVEISLTDGDRSVLTVGSDLAP
jgi:hypothetical protein